MQMLSFEWCATYP